MSTMRIRFIASFLITVVLSACQTVQPIQRNFEESMIHEGVLFSEVLYSLGQAESVDVVKRVDQSNLIAYRYTAKIDVGGGKFLLKDMTLLVNEGVVFKKVYSERIILKTEKDSRSSNNGIQIN